MKKTILLLLVAVCASISSCNQQTLETYNNTIVVAHKNLIYTNDAFFKENSTYIGDPKSKNPLIRLIKETKRKVIEDRKPVEDLVPFKDHGLRRTILEMYANTEDSMDLYAANIDLITDPESGEKTAKLFREQILKFAELDQLIRELQVQYAYYNKGTLR
jgi:hypothetical protein